MPDTSGGCTGSASIRSASHRSAAASSSPGRQRPLRRALARARTQIIANRRVIEISDAQTRLVDQLRDPRELVELDPGHLVGVRVVVAMQARREENDRDAF